MKTPLAFLRCLPRSLSSSLSLSLPLSPSLVLSLSLFLFPSASTALAASISGNVSNLAVAGSIRQRGQLHISNQKVGLHAVCLSASADYNTQ